MTPAGASTSLRSRINEMTTTTIAWSRRVRCTHSEPWRTGERNLLSPKRARNNPEFRVHSTKSLVSQTMTITAVLLNLFFSDLSIP